MSNHKRRGFSVKDAGSLLDGAFRYRKSFVLAHMLRPGFSQEDFQMTSRVSAITKETPGGGAVASSIVATNSSVLHH